MAEGGGCMGCKTVSPGYVPGLAETTVVAPSSGPGFWTGLAFGVLAGGALAALLYVGMQDEGARKALVSRRQQEIQRRRAAGYAY